MSKYQVIHEMKIKEQTLVVLDRKIDVHDTKQSTVVIDGETFSYALTHGDSSLVINTSKKINGKIGDVLPRLYRRGRMSLCQF